MYGVSCCWCPDNWWQNTHSQMTPVSKRLFSDNLLWVMWLPSWELVFHEWPLPICFDPRVGLCSGPIVLPPGSDAQDSPGDQVVKVWGLGSYDLYLEQGGNVVVRLCPQIMSSSKSDVSDSYSSCCIDLNYFCPNYKKQLYMSSRQVNWISQTKCSLSVF